MSTLQVQSVSPKPPYVNSFGKEMFPFYIGGVVDGNTDIVEMQFVSPSNAPKPGDVLEITVEVTSRGKKAKKVSQPTGQAQPTSLPSSYGASTPVKKDQDSPDERQNSIEFQSARRDAIEFMKLRVEALKVKPMVPVLSLEAYVTVDKVLEITHLLMDKNRQPQGYRSAVEVFTDGEPLPPEPDFINAEEVM